MKIVVLIVRLLLGLVFFVFGLRIRDETDALQEIQPLSETPVTLAKAPRGTSTTPLNLSSAFYSPSQARRYSSQSHLASVVPHSD